MKKKNKKKRNRQTHRQLPLYINHHHHHATVYLLLQSKCPCFPSFETPPRALLRVTTRLQWWRWWWKSNHFNHCNNPRPSWLIIQGALRKTTKKSNGVQDSHNPSPAFTWHISLACWYFIFGRTPNIKQIKHINICWVWCENLF